MSSKSFKVGFVDGFTAPFTFLKEEPQSAEKYQTTVGRAWEDVGTAFRGVMRREGIFVGKEEHSKKHRSGKRAA
jgi:hypothetical protein